MRKLNLIILKGRWTTRNVLEWGDLSPLSPLAGLPASEGASSARRFDQERRALPFDGDPSSVALLRRVDKSPAKSGDKSPHSKISRCATVLKGRPKIAQRFNAGLSVQNETSPQGTAEIHPATATVLSSLRDLAVLSKPAAALKRWAILGRPSGTKRNSTLTKLSGTRRMKVAFLLLTLLTSLPAISYAQGECLRWVRRTDVGSPGDRAGHSMAYDIHRNVTVFFGGDIPGGDEEHYFNETWEYDGTLWRRITIDGPVPPKRAMAAMAYDEVARYMVLAGGETHDGLLKDTWIYRSTEPGRGTWTYAADIPVVNDLPAERSGASLTFDENSQKLVMIGGATFDNGDEYTHATVMRWNREGGWEAHPGGGSLPLLGFRPTFARNGLARQFAAFDAHQDWLLIHGGWQGCYTEGICDPDDDPDENHYFVGLKNNRISVVTDAHPGNNPGLQQGAMVYDLNRKRFFSFGGFNVGSPVPSLDSPMEIVYTGTANPGPYAKVVISRPTLGTIPHWRTRLGMVYDRARRTTVIYGGAFGQLNFADTWELVPIFPERLRTPAERHEACEDTSVELGAYFRDPPPGYEPNTFQWMKNGALIPGATSHLLSFPAVTPNDTGQYQYILTTPCGHSLTQSPSTTLVVFLKSRITAFDAARQDRCPGDSVSWSVSATGEPPLRYQWRKNAVPLAGATSATLTLANLQHADTGDYDVQVINRCATVTSAASHLQVGVTIQAQPQSISPDVCGVGAMSVSAVGVGPLRYQWRLDGVPITGALRQNMIGVNASTLTLSPVIYAHEGKYDVVITDNCGAAHAVTSSVARVTVKPGPQWWLRATNGPSARFGHTMVYDSARRVTVLFGGRTNWAGLYPMNDLWEWDGARWTQRMAATVTNGWTSVSAFVWRVAHRDRPVQRAHHAMAYDNRRGRVVLFGGQALDPGGSTPVLRDLWEWDGTQWHFRATNGPIERLYPSMTYDERRGRIVLFGGQPVPRPGETSDSELVWEWDGERWHTNLPPQNPSGANSRSHSRMTYDSFRGVAVFGPTIENISHWSFWDWDGVKWTNFPVFHGSDPIVTVLHGTSLGGFDFDKNRRRSTWFGGLQAATVNHTAFFDGKEWTLLTNSTAPPARRVWPAMAYDSDRRAHVMFGGAAQYGLGGGTNDTWELIAVDVPLINEQPASQYRQTGGTATFSVQAVGPGVLGYQWYQGNTPLAGANADTLTIPNLSVADAGEYHVLVSNDCGTRASRSAILTLDPKLQIFSAGNTTTLLWSPAPNLVLESAVMVTGPWTVVHNAPNPLTIGALGPAKFFRLRQVE